MNRDFWRRKRVFITGHSGFKGSWLCLWLSDAGARVCGFSFPDDRQMPNMFDECGVADRIERSVFGDIRDLPSLENAYANFEPDIVIHMAAQAIVRRSYREPLNTFSTNVMGTANILDIVRRVQCAKAVVNVTTDKVYDNKEWIWPYREIERLGAADPYSASKACSELVTAAFCKSFFNGPDRPRVATARSGNVIGGGDWSEDRIIPDIVRSYANKSRLVIRNPNSIRPWQHVLEPLSGYLLLAEKLFDGGEFAEGAWNFGPSPGDDKTVQWLVERFGSDWGAELDVTCGEKDQPHEAQYLKLDSSKALLHLNWRRRLSTENAVHLTANWYKSWMNKSSVPADYTLTQIKQYEAAAGDIQV